MLRSIRLTSFAVMEEVEVSLGPGLTVLTGETGAGKSVLMEALALLAGGRAEADVVRAGADEACIEGVFEVPPEFRVKLEALGLPADERELSVCRTVTRGGRGKVHVNGCPTTVSVLARLMHGFVEVGDQHGHLVLFDADGALRILDRFGGLTGDAGPLADYRRAWGALEEAARGVAALGGDEGAVQARRELVEFQLEEIDRVAPRPGEDAALEDERRRLASVERLRVGLGQAEELVSGRDGAALELVGRALAYIVDAERFDPSLAGLRGSLGAAKAELEEVARSVSRAAGALESDPTRLAEVDDRLDALRRLCRKHACTLDALLAKRAALAAELDELASRGERRAVAARALGEARAVVARAGEALSSARRGAAERLAAAVLDGLGRLCMPSARFEVRLGAASPRSSGCDEVDFLFSANVGEPPRPLSKVASGGEASRVMLAVRAALAATDDCRCTVMDEADAGVGGAVADAVGRLLKEVAAHRQVLCITHQPQVAAHADVHLRIDKDVERGRTCSTVSRLDGGDQRALEVARMLSGVEVSQEAVDAACALLRAAGRTASSRSRLHRAERPRRGALRAS